MAGGKIEGSANPSAIRIRDNQRRSRARHKEYVEGLQQKLQDYERRGVEATLEMQQAARNVALENSRLRMLLGYHGVAAEEIDKFLQAFPDQPATEAAKATIAKTSAGRPVTASIAPKIPIQPLSRPPSASPILPKYVAPPVSREGNTREVLDAIVGIKRENRPSEATSSSIAPAPIPTERQPLVQHQPHPPTLPALPALVLGQARPEPNPVDRLAVLASASIQQDHSEGKHLRDPSIADSLHVPSPPTVGQSPPSSSAGTPGRLNSASPRIQERRSKSPLEASSRIRKGSTSESAKMLHDSDDRDDTLGRSPKIARIIDNP